MNAEKRIQEELERAIAKFPTWPTDPLHAVAVLGEEFGELTKAVLQVTYEPHKCDWSDVEKEAIQTAAMAIRFVRSLAVYHVTPGVQHQQPAILDAAIAQAEAGEAVCRWTKAPHTKPVHFISSCCQGHHANAGKFCPDCGRRVEVV